MDWNVELLMAVRTVVAALLGAAIGWERESQGSEAGIRTYGAVCVGACTFGLVSSFVDDTPDPTRIAAQVVSGVGFLGAGVILRDHGKVTGLTTAATLWVTSAIGLAIAYGMYTLGVLNCIIVILLLMSRRLYRKPTTTTVISNAPPTREPK